MKFAPVKFARLKRLAPISLAVSMVMGGIVGCDDHAPANKAALDKMDAGVATLAGIDGLAPSEGLTKAKADLTSAATESSAGPAFTAVASAGLASLDQQAAIAAISKLTTLEMDVRLTLSRIRTLTQQVSLANQYAIGYALSDPKAAVTQLSGDISSMQGNAQALTWSPIEQTQVPTLAATKQAISSIQGDISQREQEIQDLTKERADAISGSDAKLKQAETLKGDDAVKVFDEGSDLRRQADDTAIKIDLAKDQLSRLQSDLAIKKGQESAIDGGIASLQAQGQAIETAWADLQKHATAQTGFAAAIVNGDDQTKTSIKDLSAQLAKQLETVKQQRTAILDQFGEAAKYFTVARDDANKFAQSIQPNLSGMSKEVANYRALREAVHAQRYELQLGTVQRDGGSVIMTEAALLSEVQAAKTAAQTVLDAAKQQMPNELASIDTGSTKQLFDEADTRLTDAVNTLTNVESGDAPETAKNAAKVARLITMQNHIALYNLKEAAGDASAKAQAAQMNTDAMQLKADIIQSGLTLPALPGELGTVPPPAAPQAAPATPGAATAPGTSDSTDAAPAAPATPAPAAAQ